MIGIRQLDNLTTAEMVDVIEGRLRLAVRDPRKIQTTVEDISEPITLSDPNNLMMDHNTVITLLKMEIESRMGWAYVAEKIAEAKH